MAQYETGRESQDIKRQLKETGHSSKTKKRNVLQNMSRYGHLYWRQKMYQIMKGNRV